MGHMATPNSKGIQRIESLHLNPCCHIHNWSPAHREGVETDMTLASQPAASASGKVGSDHAGFRLPQERVWILL